MSVRWCGRVTNRSGRTAASKRQRAKEKRRDPIGGQVGGVVHERFGLRRSRTRATCCRCAVTLSSIAHGQKFCGFRVAEAFLHNLDLHESTPLLLNGRQAGWGE